MTQEKLLRIVEFIREIYSCKDDSLPIHEPCFNGNEKKYLSECIDTNYVSSIGKFVSKFEQMVSGYTGSKYAIATVNGTAALHVSLMLCGVDTGDEVITQPLTFVATVNAISYLGAIPVFCDVDMDTLGLSSVSLRDFLENNTTMKNGYCTNKISRRRIKACIPMHTFGHPCRIKDIVSICRDYNIDVVEDAAESLGSYYKEKHTGTFGKCGILSFNGNKTITTGGGGMILTGDNKIATLAKHLTTTAKVSHPWEFVHDMIGYNYRLTNLSAALGCAQMEQLPYFIDKKRELAEKYSTFFKDMDVDFFSEPRNCRSNYWLNIVILKDSLEQRHFLEYMHKHNIMARPAWTLMNRLEMYKNCQSGPLRNSEWYADRLVNIPSSVIS